ncbi:MAG: hypothetical protein ACUVV0_10665 [Anaerolineae bacterium]
MVKPNPSPPQGSVSRSKDGSRTRRPGGKRTQKRWIPPPPPEIEYREYSYPLQRRLLYALIAFIATGSALSFYIWTGSVLWRWWHGYRTGDIFWAITTFIFVLALTPFFIHLTWWLVGAITTTIVVSKESLRYHRLGQHLAVSWKEVEGYREELALSPYGANRVATVWAGGNSFSFHDHLLGYDDLTATLRKRVAAKEEAGEFPLGGGRLGRYLWLTSQVTLALLGVLIIVFGVLGAVSAALEGSLLGVITWLTLFLLGFGLISWMPEEFNKHLRALAERLGEVGLFGAALLLFSLVWLYPTVGGIQREDQRQIVNGLLLLGACFLPGLSLSLLAWWRGRGR